jgi:tryptophan halogenase
MNNIVIVGGGTSGWLTALYLNSIYKTDAQITLIESEDIGILGAGEGSVPVLYGFLESLGIDIVDFIIKTNATHKIGVNFVNWNGDGKQYFHSFGSSYEKDDYLINDTTGEFIVSEYLGYLYKKGSSLNDSLISNKLALDGASPFIITDDKKIDSHSRFSYHFDARLVANYFREICEKRGVVRIEGKVIEFERNSFNHINKIILSDGTKVNADFVFDCSGFSRLVIGKLYNTPWKSYHNQLRVNRAITFNIPVDSVKIGSYTNAIAMKYGWMWQIPLQTRIGCGYNFDKTYITDEEALNEIHEYFGFKPTINQIISYTAGRYENAWVGNCIAVGLSLGFTEPIEATSIFHIIAQLTVTTRDILDKHTSSSLFTQSKIANQYNSIMASAQDNTLIFLYFHYFTKRVDTPFWKEYLSKTTIPNSLSHFLNKWKTDPIQLDDFSKDVQGFKYHNWLAVADGLDYFNKDIYIKAYEQYVSKNQIYNHDLKLSNSYFTYKKKIITDNEFIKQIKKNPK